MEPNIPSFSLIWHDFLEKAKKKATLMPSSNHLRSKPAEKEPVERPFDSCKSLNHNKKSDILKGFSTGKRKLIEIEINDREKADKKAKKTKRLN